MQAIQVSEKNDLFHPLDHQNGSFPELEVVEGSEEHFLLQQPEC